MSASAFACVIARASGGEVPLACAPNRPPHLGPLQRRAVAVLAVVGSVTARQLACGLGKEVASACVVLRGLRAAGLVQTTRATRVQVHASVSGQPPRAYMLSALGLFWTPRPTVTRRGQGHLAGRDQAVRRALTLPAGNGGGLERVA